MKNDKLKTSLYQQLLETAECAGLKVISDERCCQLMAWLLEIGGYTEESTHNIKLRADIFTAQKRLNLFGGEKPNQKLLPMFRERYQEILDFINEKTNKPQWLTNLEEYYKIKVFKPIRK